MSRTWSEAEIEREQIEWVFGLTGGELENKPLHYTRLTEFSGPREASHVYWYVGCPDYIERLERQEWEDPDAVTLVVFGGGHLPAPDSWIITECGAWFCVAVFNNSGECECPLRDSPGDAAERCADEYGRCVYCEEDVAVRGVAVQEHGYIYIGEGYEAVYSLVSESGTDRDEWSACEGCSRVVHNGEKDEGGSDNDLCRVCMRKSRG